MSESEFCQCDIPADNKTGYCSQCNKLIKVTTFHVNNRNGNSKFILTVRTTTFERLNKIAEKKGITLQELLRAIVIPQYIQREGLLF